MPVNHSFLWGHLQNLGEIQRSFPATAGIGYTVTELAKPFTNGLFYIDTWPFSDPMLVVNTPTAANALQKYSSALLKPDDVNGPLNTLCAGSSMMTMPEDQWKQWRLLFNPSFSITYLTELAPTVANEVSIFCEKLRDIVKKGKRIELEPLASRLTIDVVGRISFGESMNHQRNDNPIAATVRSQAMWISFNSVVEPWTTLNPRRPFMNWYNNRLFKKYIGAVVDRRFAEVRASSISEKAKTKALLPKALEHYISNARTNGSSPDHLDPGFKSSLISNMIIFMVAGHETSSTTICMCIHSLATNPEYLARLRAEHDAVFGTDISTSHIMSMVQQEPERLNKLPYTLAVIKETLRLYPPVAGIRSGTPDVNLPDDSGKLFPTAGIKIWTVHAALHRNEKYWPEPNTFIPDRWLAKEGDRLHPIKGAWRPFEHGSRNCIGQALALIELKLVLIMIMREFDFEPAYAEDDSEVFGNKAFLAGNQGVGEVPYKGYPVRVKTANRP
ncbi:cytochrome P450 [Bimuria novae-zelandiae CBS 107.79]|uniref:Cytochrome P450 n=1 Tax=Bimuria novae-zelandiae CBS 107.79 TaxID=1447943 RepID=A0A6A5VRQ0_9PLEO|nr:cytochrome P450 [Bimuria novae-zelandiae CBS 107.79]